MFTVRDDIQEKMFLASLFLLIKLEAINRSIDAADDGEDDAVDCMPIAPKVKENRWYLKCHIELTFRFK